MYNPADIRWDVLNDIMSSYYLHNHQILGLNGVPRKRRKTGKDSKTMEASEKHRAAVGGKVVQVLDDIAKVPAKYTNVLKDKLT